MTVVCEWKIDSWGPTKKTLKIDMSEFEDDMSPDDIRNLVYDLVEDHFRETVFFDIINLESVVSEVEQKLKVRK